MSGERFDVRPPASGGGASGVSSFNTRTGAVSLTSADLTALVTMLAAGSAHIVVGGTTLAPSVDLSTADKATLAAALQSLAAGSAHVVIGGTATAPTVDLSAGDKTILAAALQSLVAADTSIVVGGTATAPTLATGTLDVVATNHPPAGDVPMNGHKLTGLAAGSATGHSARWNETTGLVTNAGDLLVASASGVLTRLAASSTSGQALRANPNGSGASKLNYGVASGLPTLACPGVAENYPRLLVSGVTAAIDTTGRLSGYAMPLLAGQTVTSITFVSGTTAIATPTHYWFALYSPAVATSDFPTPYSLISQTADQTSTAWAASTALTLALGTPYLALTDGAYYVAIMCAAATIPNFYGIQAAGGGAALSPGDFSLSPPAAWSSSASLTTTAPNPAVPAGSRISGRPYIVVT